jgi:hypothetical protein
MTSILTEALMGVVLVMSAGMLVFGPIWLALRNAG